MADTNRERANGADATRTKQARIHRLRSRLKQLDPKDDVLVSVLKGVLDLLEDEL